MDVNETESSVSVKYVRPPTKSDVFKPLRSTESSRNLGSTKRFGKSLASLRRDINKSFSKEVFEALLKEGKNLEEVSQSSTDFYSYSTRESVPSFKYVSKQLSIRSQGKSQGSIFPEDPNKPAREGKSDNTEFITGLGNFMTDVEKLSSVLNMATKFVDDIISEANRVTGKTDQLKSKTVLLVPLKDLCLKSEEAQRDRHSVFDFANNFVDNILNESTRRSTNLKVFGIERFHLYHCLDDFKVKDGLEIVAKCISRWSFNRNWFYRTIYHARMISEESHSLFYTVRWSVPTPSYPVAQVTVDVNFTVEVVRLMTSPFYIEVINASNKFVVWYRVETDRSQHSAFNSKFIENWLKKVVKRKLQAYKMFKF